jgi:hypothetical protein
MRVTDIVRPLKSNWKRPEYLPKRGVIKEVDNKFNIVLVKWDDGQTLWQTRESLEIVEWGERNEA